MAVFVISKYGERLMPTTCYGKVRHMLKDGRAVICKRNPFTIQLTYDSKTYVQPIEVCVDTGDQHIGISVKSEKQEFISEQRDLLQYEKKHHDDRRKLRRTRRNRLRYRAPRFDNRRASKKPGWFAPTVKNKADRHIDLVAGFVSVCPVASIVLEVGSFDTMLLKAIQEGKPIPQGTDYQQGPAYWAATRRAAVFQRDSYKCLFCGRGIKEGAILHEHHAYFWKGRHSDSIDELVTCCEKCHTPENHKEGGKLWGFDNGLKSEVGAAFMNTARWYIVNRIKDMLPGIEVKTTYGTSTKMARDNLGLAKSHANDAYAMGKLHPEKRADTQIYQKRCRNNRCLEKFYDAKYVDIRDGSIKSGAQLGCQRINRREPRNNDKDQRMYRGPKKAKGKRVIRRKHYQLQPGDIVCWKSNPYTVVGVHSNGTRVLINYNNTKKSVAIKQAQLIHHISGGWVKTERRTGNSSQP